MQSALTQAASIKVPPPQARSTPAPRGRESGAGTRAPDRQSAARLDRCGLWADDAPVPPLEWRAKKKGNDMRRTFVRLRRLALLFGICIFSYALPDTTFAHGGGLDANGCHTNRKTGEYHCHRNTGSTSGTTPAPPQKGAASTPPSTQVDNTCYTGPRGGRYRIVNGKKRYGC